MSTYFSHSYSGKKFTKSENPSRRLMVHQTTPQAAESILKSQKMLPGSHGTVGPAIYFARTMPETDQKAHSTGTYLMADVYLGKTTLNTTFSNGATSVLYTQYTTGKEYAVKDPERVKNIRYLAGVKPPNIKIQMRERMPLIYATDSRTAAAIIKNQRIPPENRADLLGNGYYLWENVPDAEKYAKGGKETFLAADVYFPQCDDCKLLPPSKSDLLKYSTFRGKYHDTHYYMVKNPAQIEKIHYIGGKRP